MRGIVRARLNLCRRRTHDCFFCCATMEALSLSLLSLSATSARCDSPSSAHCSRYASAEEATIRSGSSFFCSCRFLVSQQCYSHSSEPKPLAATESTSAA